MILTNKKSWRVIIIFRLLMEKMSKSINNLSKTFKNKIYKIIWILNTNKNYLSQTLINQQEHHKIDH